MYKLVLIRHGQSQWNLENRFTGWADVPLTDQGIGEAQAAAQLLKDEGFQFDVAHTSVLKRAIKTLWTVLEGMDQMWIPVHRHWQLNERHYGGLTGLDKAETAAKHGADQVKIWRRSYDTPPPHLDPSDERHPRNDPKYGTVDPDELPGAESLKLTLERVLPLWDSTIAPDIRAGKQVIVAAHGNSLRALVKHLDEMSESAILELNIPTGVPLVYELDADLKPIKHYYLGDAEAIAAAAAAVANQGKA